MSKPNSNKKETTRSLIIGVIHRHPSGSYTTFQEQLRKILRKFIYSNQAFILMGDYNIDSSKQNTNKKVTDYLNELYSAGCCSLINKPTRITDTSATTLDHIYSNSLHKISVSGVLISDISDHLPTFCVMTSNIERNLTPKLRIREMKKFNIEAFSEEISNSLESSFRNYENDPNVIILKILNVITEITNK